MLLLIALLTVRTRNDIILAIQSIARIVLHTLHQQSALFSLPPMKVTALPQNYVLSCGPGSNGLLTEQAPQHKVLGIAFPAGGGADTPDYT